MLPLRDGELSHRRFVGEKPAIDNFASSAPDNKISVRIMFHKCSMQICIHRNPDVSKGDRCFYDLLSKPELCLLVEVEEQVAGIRTDDMRKHIFQLLPSTQQ